MMKREKKTRGGKRANVGPFQNSALHGVSSTAITAPERAEAAKLEMSAATSEAERPPSTETKSQCTSRCSEKYCGTVWTESPLTNSKRLGNFSFIHFSTTFVTGSSSKSKEMSWACGFAWRKWSAE